MTICIVCTKWIKEELPLLIKIVPWVNSGMGDHNISVDGDGQNVEYRNSEQAIPQEREQLNMKDMKNVNLINP